jgi:hypothetical protein
MRSLILICLVTLVALIFSGCVIVDEYHYGHRHHSGVIVTNVPFPPPPPLPFIIVGPEPHGPPPHRYYAPRPGPVPGPGRRDPRR